jgi:uncharacterized phage protein (TIGR01671 family)
LERKRRKALREIKFRAWDTRAKLFVIAAHLMNIHTGEISEVPDRFILEQYTGLKDKNGREIYEGDILAYSEYDHRGVVQFALGTFGLNWDYNKSIDPLYRDGRLFGSWGQLHNLRRLDDGDILDEAIVVGNIHENPELLK